MNTNNYFVNDSAKFVGQAKALQPRATNTLANK